MDKDPTLNMLEVKPNLEPVFKETTTEQGQSDFLDFDSEHKFESETDKRLREISETVVEMEKANKEQIEFYVLGSGAMMYSMEEAGFTAEEISQIMSERRKISNHGMDLDVAVSSEEDLSVMREQMDFIGNENQGKFGKHEEVVDLMVRKKLLGFEPEEVMVDGNPMLVQSTDEMIFEKTDALTSEITNKEPKWAEDRETLKEIIRRGHGTSAEEVDRYLEGRYEEYSTRKLEVALDELLDVLGNDTSKRVEEIINEDKILSYLPNIDSGLLKEFKAADESNILEIVSMLEPTMLPQWAQVDAEAKAAFS